MKKVLFYICLISFVFTFQGCPDVGPNQEHYDPQWGAVAILSPQDSVYVRYYDSAELPHEMVLSPSSYLQQAVWYAEYDKDVLHSEEIHELHVRKLTNNDESIVIEGDRIYINDTLWGYESFYDPADSIVIDWDWGSLSYDTTIVHYEQCPYELSDVIEQLSLHYPDLVHRLNDTVEHNFSNHQIIRDRKNWPRIYLPAE
jgi:hypothetical protein